MAAARQPFGARDLPSIKVVEERAGMRLLDSYVDTTLKELRRNQGKLPPPDEADMPQVKEPDDTRDANDDW